MFKTEAEARTHLEKVRNDPPFANHNFYVTHWTPEPKKKLSRRSGRSHSRR
jgi:hypothetical protein